MNGAKSAGFHVRDLIDLSDKRQTLLQQQQQQQQQQPLSSPQSHADDPAAVQLQTAATGADIEGATTDSSLLRSMPEITDLSQSMAIMTSSYDNHDNPYARWLSSQDGAMSYYSSKFI